MCLRVQLSAPTPTLPLGRGEGLEDNNHRGSDVTNHAYGLKPPFKPERVGGRASTSW